MKCESCNQHNGNRTQCVRCARRCCLDCIKRKGICPYCKKHPNMNRRGYVA